MQFRLSNLFTLTAIVGVLAGTAAPLIRHWDLKSYYVGFYGRHGVPSWATGTGTDSVSESLGAMMGVVWACGPWFLLVGLAAFGAAMGIHAKGGIR